MYPSLPLTSNRLMLHRLAYGYVVCFWALFAFFALSLIQAGYDPALAVTACSFAGIACSLLRLEQKLDSQIDARDHLSIPVVGLQTPADKYTVALGQLLIQVDEHLREAKGKQGQVGLLLIRVEEEAAHLA